MAIPLAEVQRRLDAQGRSYITLDAPTYKNLKTKARFIDLEFGEWWATPDDVLQGKDHPKRGLLKRTKSQTTSPEEVQKRLMEEGRYHIVLDGSTYVNLRTKARFIDSEFGEWWAIPSSVLQGQDHPKRGLLKRIRSRTLPPEEIQKRLNKQGRFYISLDSSTYKNTHTKARFIDSEYGEWWALPSAILRGSDHPERGKIKQAKTKASLPVEIQKKLKDQGRSYISIDSLTYKNAQTKARFIDSEFGEWWATPNNVLQGKSHPSRFANRSKAEEEIFKWLKDELRLNVINNYRLKVNSQAYEVDIYLPDQQLGIEYHGLYWHSEEQVTKTYHFNKREFFNSQGIQLIQIYEDEWRDKSEIVKSIIRTKLGLSKERYYARNLTIKEVTSKEAQEFLRENHLMGEYRSAKGLGLYTKEGELVSFISYKKYKNGLDISRFCNKINTVVVGGLSKLLTTVELKYPEAECIQSWVDLRYSTGDSLIRTGFQHIKTTLGWKWTDGVYTFNRLKCRANMDERKLTEKEYATELEWFKIYDAGQSLFVKKVAKIKKI